MLNPAHQIREFWPCFYKVVEGCDSALEFGCGHGHNLRRTGSKVMVGVECVPSYPVEDGQVVFHIGDALELAPTFSDQSFDLVLLIDVVEHFVKEQGVRLLLEAKRIARKTVLVWCPKGHSPQDEHHFDIKSGYTYEPSQEHRSEWHAKDLQELGFDAVVWDNYHVNLITYKKDIGALFAVCSRGTT